MSQRRTSPEKILEMKRGEKSEGGVGLTSVMRRYVSDDLIDLLESAWSHIEELKRRLLIVIICLGAAALFFLMVGFHQTDVAGATIYLPDADYTRSFSARALEMIEADLVPQDVQIITLSPTDAIVNQMKIALVLALIVCMPLIIYEFAMFVGPGLKPREKRIMIFSLVPASILFLIGALVGYLFVATWAFDFLFSFAVGFIDGRFLHISSLISFALMLVIAMGLAFELPVLMVGLSRAGIVDRSFWRNNWRYAAVAILIFGAVITPDGSGITMLIVATPMLALYFVGYLFS